MKTPKESIYEVNVPELVWNSDWHLYGEKVLKLQGKCLFDLASIGIDAISSEKHYA
jgi:hypothetical protein